jgi:RimJ/RimL family protein N-acetyltransferase
LAGWLSLGSEGGYDPTITMEIVLETDRLLLRRLTLDEVDDLLGIFSDPEAMRYYPTTKGRQETLDWIVWNLGRYGNHGFGLWAVIRKDTGDVCRSVWPDYAARRCWTR